MIPVLHVVGVSGSEGGVLHAIVAALEESFYICLLAMTMMVLIELFNVTTKGRLFRDIGRHRFGQIAITAALGLIPGCIGGFAGVSLYSHRIVSFGALLALLVTTTGDEAFLMLASFPGTAVAMIAGLYVLGVIAGYVTDRIMSRKKPLPLSGDMHVDDNYEIHACDCESLEREHEHSHGHAHGRNTGKVKHFLREHVWHHVIRRHLPTIFAWSFGVLAIFGVLGQYVDIESWVRGNSSLMIILAVLIGMIPESGPHMVFVTMFAHGLLPFPVLLASSIAQDGHSCLPLIAENKESFFVAKAIKAVLALAVGFTAMLFV